MQNNVYEGLDGKENNKIQMKIPDNELTDYNP